MVQSPDFLIEPLGKKHDRTALFVWEEQLDSYLQKQAGQDARRRVAAPFGITPDQKTIAGFYTLSQFAIDLGNVPAEPAKQLPNYELVLATLIGRLAVSIDFRGQGLGRKLLMDALHRSLQLSTQVSSAAVIVDAKGDEALSFDLDYGFIEIPRVGPNSVERCQG